MVDFKVDSAQLQVSTGYDWDTIRQVILNIFEDDIQNQLGIPEQDPEIRFSPSIITRSENELGCVGAPRFALRLNIGAGVVNLRQLEIFKQGLERKMAKASKEFSEIHMVADCLLVAPRILRDNYHILAQEKLWNAYGEHSELKDVTGWFGLEELPPCTPYLRMIKLGGGVCAQAVAFMASLLVYDKGEEKIQRIYSLLEITTNMADQEVERAKRDGKTYQPPSGVPDTSISLGGLSPLSVVDFIKKKLKLGANIEQFTLGKLFHPWGKLNVEKALLDQESRESKVLLNKLFSYAISAYIRSDFPVILRVDADRMKGIAQRNNGKPEHTGENLGFKLLPEFKGIYPLDDQKPKRKTTFDADHMVVVVGAHKDGGKFLFNDPSGKAFYPATAEQLIECCTYKNDASEEQRRNGITLIRHYLTREIIPVVPGGVNIPLGGDALIRAEDTFRAWNSLFLKSWYATTAELKETVAGEDGENIGDIPRYRANDYHHLFSNIRLGQGKHILPWIDEFLEEEGYAQNHILKDLKAEDDRYYWLQLVDDGKDKSAWIYDSQLPESEDIPMYQMKNTLTRKELKDMGLIFVAFQGNGGIVPIKI